MTSASFDDRVGANHPPEADPSITEAAARELVATQMPDLAHLPLGGRFDGWDMVTYRLGEHHALRMPRVVEAVASLNTEIRWIAQLSPGWNFPCPRIERVGEPGAGFPWRWAVVSWVPGATADAAPLLAQAGPDIGRALAQVHTPAPADAPFNREQSVRLVERADDVAWSLRQLADARGPDGESIDPAMAHHLWADAMAATEPKARLWGHADAHGSNVLSHGGAFAGIIDWGKMAVCDRAVDLGFLYTLMPAAGVDAAVREYREATQCDDPDLEKRLRGIALNKCLLWATLDRPANVTMAWRGLNALGVTRYE
jgi:aminoglycoside phosphotransferase (APT) family kinase protein